MILLQPELIWGLLAAPLPLLIHWLNRLRYRRILWAAMSFLHTATRTSTRRSRIRHWLILACRVIAFTSLLLLLTRPLVGGRLGKMFAGPPDLVLIALDRSASMEMPAAEHARSRRLTALESIATMPPELWRGVRCVLVDSVTFAAQTIATPAVLPYLDAAAGTHAGANIPSLLSACVHAFAAERPGRAELWIVSDLQTSSWRPQDPRWRTVAASLAAVPQDLTVRLLVNSGRPPANRTVQWMGARRVETAQRRRVDITVAVRAEGQFVDEPVLISWNAMGVHSPSEVRPTSQFMVLQRSFDWPPNEPTFWGSVEVPPDAAPVDDRVYFAIAEPEAVKAVIVAENEECERRIRYALAPFETGRVHVVRASSGSFTHMMTGRIAMIVIQGKGLNDVDMEAVRPWVREGTTSLWLPPANADSAPVEWGWGPVEEAPQVPWQIVAWDRRDGPLQDGADGIPLSIDRVRVFRRRSINVADPHDETHALLNDGVPLLVSHRLQRGRSYALATLPLENWSTLADGWVWLPMLQRILEEGARRWQVAETAVCGRWYPNPDQAWKAWEGSPAPATGGLSAGIFLWGDRMMALNRPDEEDDPEALPIEWVRQQLAPVRVGMTMDFGSTPDGEARRGEISVMLATLAMLALVAESWLLGAEHGAPASQ